MCAPKFVREVPMARLLICTLGYSKHVLSPLRLLRIRSTAHCIEMLFNIHSVFHRMHIALPLSLSSNRTILCFITSTLDTLSRALYNLSTRWMQQRSVKLAEWILKHTGKFVNRVRCEAVVVFAVKCGSLCAWLCVGRHGGSSIVCERPGRRGSRAAWLCQVHIEGSKPGAWLHHVGAGSKSFVEFKLGVLSTTQSCLVLFRSCYDKYANGSSQTL